MNASIGSLEGVVRRPRVLKRTVSAGFAAIGVLMASEVQADERASRLFHEVGIALGFPTGVVAAVSYTPSLSLFDRRLNMGLGARFSSYFDGAYPNGDADLLAVGASNTLTVSEPRNYALNLVFGISLPGDRCSDPPRAHGRSWPRVARQRGDAGISGLVPPTRRPFPVRPASGCVPPVGR